MAAIPQPSGEITVATPTGPDSGAWRRVAAFAMVVTAILSLLIILVGASLLVYGRVQRGDSVFDGVSAAGVDLGGKSHADAVALLADRFAAFSDTEIAFSVGDTSFSATPAELGATFDAQATADNAYDFGRRQSLWQESRNWLDSIVGGHEVAPVVQLDPEKFGALMDQRARSAAVPPREAAFVQNADGSVSIDAGASGVAVDVDETYRRVVDRLVNVSDRPVTIATTEIPQTVESAQLQSALSEAQTLAGQPLMLELDGASWQIPAEDLFGMLSVSLNDDNATVSLDRNKISRTIGALESSVFTPGVDASIRNDTGTVVTTPSIPGKKLDIDASTTAAIAALEAGESTTTLVTTPVAANITDDMTAAAQAEAASLIAEPVTVTWDSGTVDLRSEQLAAALQFDTNSGRTPAITVSLNTDLVGKFLAPVAEQVKVAGKNADLRWINGAVEVRSPETNGRELDINATVSSIVAGVQDGNRNVAAITMDVAPQVTAAMASSVDIREKLTSASTEYGYSSASRLHNVELAASRVDGALIPPGGTFSFNEAVGPVTYDSGYQTGYGIMITNGSISTVPSVGGGICQVATTVFQSVFWAGMPIVERSWHLYWIPRYGQGQGGLKGLDATVDPDYDLDFKFHNASNNWLAVKTNYDGMTLGFELWGTPTGWNVAVDQPVITNVVAASQEMYYEDSAELPRGTSVFVEHAEDGFNAAIHRVVTDGNGQVIDDTVFHSNYAPAKNTTLVGTGG